MASKKGMTISIKPEDVVFTSIQKSKDNYNSARMVVKVGDKAYMSVGVEWEGETIPAMAMDMMGTLTAGEITPNTIVAGREADYEEYEMAAAKDSKKEDKMKKDKKDKKDGKDGKDGKDEKEDKMDKFKKMKKDKK